MKWVTLAKAKAKAKAERIASPRLIRMPSSASHRSAWSSGGRER